LHTIAAAISHEQHNKAGSVDVRDVVSKPRQFGTDLKLSEATEARMIHRIIGIIEREVILLWEEAANYCHCVASHLIAATRLDTHPARPASALRDLWPHAPRGS